MRRLAIHCESRCVDLALPADAPVGLLLPAVVDLVGPDINSAAANHLWHLSPVGRPRLDEAMSLRDNAVHDGESLVLTTTEVPAPAELAEEPCQAIIKAADARTVPNRAAVTATCLSATALSAAALVWSGTVIQATGHAVAAGFTAVAAAFGAVVMRRAHPDPVYSIVLSVITVMFGTAAGFLAVPAGSATARLLLAAAVTATLSILLHRVTRCGAICLSALATAGALTSAAAACAVAWTLPVPTMGAVLAAGSLAALGLAARFAIAATGLAPAMPNPDSGGEDDRTVAGPQALSAHRALSGLVIGSATAAAVGTVVLAWGCVPNGPPSAIVFAFVIAVVLALRARSHLDTHRRSALVVAGVVAVFAGCVIAVAAAPERAQWVCLLPAIAGVTMLDHTSAARNPLVRKAVDVLEYGALTAVVPAACWVGGLYTSVRGLSLP